MHRDHVSEMQPADQRRQGALLLEHRGEQVGNGGQWGQVFTLDNRYTGHRGMDSEFIGIAIRYLAWFYSQNTIFPLRTRRSARS